MSKSPQYKVIAWGQKGQKSGTRVISKKPYKQSGSARNYAQKQSAVKSRAFVVHYVSLMQGDTEIERFKNGDIDKSFTAAEPKPVPGAEAAAARISEVMQSADGATKYESELRKYKSGQIKWPPKRQQYGLSNADVKAIRDRVNDEASAPPLHTVDAAAKRRKQQKRKPALRKQPTAAKRQQASEQLQMLQLDAATAEAAMQALLRERQAAVKAAQSDLENTLAQCAQIGVHGSIA